MRRRDKDGSIKYINNINNRLNRSNKDGITINIQ